MQSFDEGLRCQDIHSGLRDIDPNSPLLGPLNDTRLVGMAANVAGLIRGRDVIEDAQALMQVAAYQLDVHMLSFGQVLELLQDAGYVQGVQRTGGKITSFTETVPYYNDLYDRLGEVWRGRQPTELEQQLVQTVDGLSHKPIPLETLAIQLDLDEAAMPQLLEIGKGSGLICVLPTLDGDIAYSPFFGFENPDLIGALAVDYGSDQLVEEFQAVRARQGLELTPGTYPVLTSAVAGGLLLAPSVVLPDGTSRAFAALPYVPDKSLLTARKPVLDKALAVLACLRCAENHGEYNRLDPAALASVINKLLDPSRGFLNPNEAHRRQYALMRNAGIIRFGPDTKPGGNWVTPIFIDTEDNREALILARDLILHGELVEHRIDDNVARSALEAGRNYLAPMQTTTRLRKQVSPSPKHFARMFDKAMGRGAL